MSPLIAHILAPLLLLGLLPLHASADPALPQITRCRSTGSDPTLLTRARRSAWLPRISVRAIATSQPTERGVAVLAFATWALDRPAPTALLRLLSERSARDPAALGLFDLPVVAGNDAIRSVVMRQASRELALLRLGTTLCGGIP